jgi:riboflavin synthase
MFTGIVEALGTVSAVERADDRARLTIETPLAAAFEHGESIAVDGVCLTVAGTTGPDGAERRPGDLSTAFAADVVAETLGRSTLGDRRPGERVNLERAATLQSRLSGHLLQGHVDGVGTLLDRTRGAGGETVRIGLPEPLARYVVEKGSIAVDGISLTVVQAGSDNFSVALIPTTLAGTTLGDKQAGVPVNLEVDVIAKYVERLLASAAGAGG